MSRLASTLLLLGLTTLQVSAQTYIPSQQLFNLKLRSQDPALDGHYLTTCHSAAAIWQLCVGDTDGSPIPPDTFGFNTTAGDTTGTGILTWELRIRTMNISTGLSIEAPLTSNVAFVTVGPAASPAAYTPLGFDAGSKLFLPSANLYQFHVCFTLYTSYYYQALTWVTSGQPINPTCRPVDVVRVFV